ncbi:MAG: hypothetical protein LC737_09205 [Chloroflexi bacterium]|nr:hypothetical protein [Chloroflexota bacterium]
MTLTRRARIVLDTLLPAQAHAQLPLGLFDAEFESFQVEFERSATLQLRLAFGVALFVAVWLSPLLIHHLPPLTRHGRETRERALAALAHSRIYVLRQLLTVLKLVTSLCYGAHPTVRDAIGYPHAWPPRESA